MKKFLKMLMAMALTVFLLGGCIVIPVEKKGAIPDKEAEPKKEDENVATVEVVPEKKTESEVVQKAELVDELSGDERYELNIFLSNLSEAMYDPVNGYYYTEEAMISFVYIHALINSPSKLYYEDGYMGISQDYADTTLKRFFGKTISPVDLRDAKDWFYDGEYYLRSGASGEFYGYFSIVTSVEELPSGEYNVSFNIYSDDSDYTITNKSVYGLKNAEAAASYNYCGSGTAVLKKKTVNGKKTYEVVSYDQY